MALWLNRYATAVLPSIREKCHACNNAPVCSKCGAPLPVGWERRYCRHCRAEYDAARSQRKKHR